MINFFEHALRRGICQVSCKYASSNRIYSDTYNPEKKIEEILYLDANGLYAYAMTSKLPTGDFKWIEDLENLKNDILNGTIQNRYGTNQIKSCLLECDLKYPKDLYDKHANYPFCPEHKMTLSKTKK